jgi:hypothetical protein
MKMKKIYLLKIMMMMMMKITRINKYIFLYFLIKNLLLYLIKRVLLGLVLLNDII